MSPSRTQRPFSDLTAAFVVTVSLFALWGVGRQLSGVLLPRIAEPLHLKGFELTLSYYIASFVYMLGALPAAIYATRLGFKAAVLFGLSCYALGCFTLYSSLAVQAHYYFFFAATVMTLGWVFLDVAANPLAGSLGPDNSFVWRVNVAQAVFPVGTLVAIVSEKWLLGTHAVAGVKIMLSATHPLALLGAVVWLVACVFEANRFPPIAVERTSIDIGAALRRLLSDRCILFAMIAQGAGIVILIVNGAIGSRYLGAAFHPGVAGSLGDVFFWAGLIFAAGRFSGCALMRFVSPLRLLAIFSVAGIACSLIAAAGWTTISAFAVLANQFFASIMWPTILGLAIRGRGPLMKVATALVCMGGAIGANLYFLVGATWPSVPKQVGMLLPAICFAVVFGFALSLARRDIKAPARAAAPMPQTV